MEKKYQAIILCAGSSSRWKWKDHMNIPKQLVPVPDEPLLHRTIRLLRKYGYGEPVVVTHNDKLKSSKYLCFEPKKRRWTVETMLSTSNIWSDTTCIFLGDVYYSENTFNYMKETHQKITFYGRIPVDKYRGEIFAIFFDRKYHEKMKKSLNSAIILAEKTNSLNEVWQPLRRLMFMLKGVKATRKNFIWDAFWDNYQKIFSLKLPQPYIWGRLWSLFYVLFEVEFTNHVFYNRKFIELNDETMDFDYPEDYQSWLSEWMKNKN